MTVRAFHQVGTPSVIHIYTDGAGRNHRYGSNEPTIHLLTRQEVDKMIVRGNNNGISKPWHVLDINGPSRVIQRMDSNPLYPGGPLIYIETSALVDAARYNLTDSAAMLENPGLIMQLTGEARL